MPARKASVKRREEVADAAAGLLAEQAATAFSCSIIETKDLDPKLVSAEKRKLVATVQGLTWVEPDPRGLDAVGGYRLLKRFVLSKLEAFSPEAREYGVPQPKGLMLAGVSGCGKTPCVPGQPVGAGAAAQGRPGWPRASTSARARATSTASWQSRRQPHRACSLRRVREDVARGGEDGGSEAYLGKILSCSRTARRRSTSSSPATSRAPAVRVRARGRADETSDRPARASERAEIRHHYRAVQSRP
jgi:hypothetical protein